MIVYLVEVDTAMRFQNWGASIATGTYSKTLAIEVNQVESVTQDGTALTLAASLAAVNTTASRWYYDAATRELRVHTSDDADPATKVMVAVVLEPLVFGRSFVLSRSGVPLYWDGRVVDLPSVNQRIADSEPEGGGSVASFGMLRVDNRDARYDRLIGERSFFGQEVRVYRGDDTSAYTSFTLWLRATIDEVSLTGETFVVTLMSAARKLDAPVLTKRFRFADYPAMDPVIDGLPIPLWIWKAFEQEAFRIASGRWKCSGRHGITTGNMMTSIDAVYKTDGTSVTVLTTDLVNGEFTVAASLDTESRLWVDGTGVQPDGRVGDIIRELGKAAGLVTNSTALNIVNENRKLLVDANGWVSAGFQITGGSYRDAINVVAQSAFVDWVVTREGNLSGYARELDINNMIRTRRGSDFDLGGGIGTWEGANGAVLRRQTTPTFRGRGCLQIGKPAGAASSLARANTSGTTADFVAGKPVTITLVAALLSGSTSQFRLALQDFVGIPFTRFISDPVTLSATQWTRVTATLTPTATGVHGVEIYPSFGTTDAVVVLVDDIDVVQSFSYGSYNVHVVKVDDGVLEAPLSASIEGPVIWKSTVGYRFTRRRNDRRYAEYQDEAILRTSPTAESRQVEGSLVAFVDADTIAASIVHYFGTPRLRISGTLRDVSTPLQVWDVLDVQSTRRPTAPGTWALFRVVSFAEIHDAAGSRVAFEAVGPFDPVFDISTVVAPWTFQFAAGTVYRVVDIAGVVSSSRRNRDRGGLGSIGLGGLHDALGLIP